MIPFAYRDPHLARLRWLALVGLGALASIASFFPFAMEVRDPAARAGAVAEFVLFFASVAMLAMALVGYARARRREERERASAADGADD